MIISNGDTRRGVEALRKLDFYMHMDLYENPTSRFADILLPAASAWESEFVGRHEWRDRGHLQLRRKVVEPEYERRGDLEVMFELATRMGLGDAFFGGSIDRAFNHMLSPLGKTFAEIREMPNGLAVPLTPTYKKYEEINPETGRPRGMQTYSGLVEIYSKIFAENGYEPLPNYSEPPERNVDRTKYPLLLTFFKPTEFIHGSYRSIPSLRKEFPQPTLEIHPLTAEHTKISDGEWVMIGTPKGTVKAQAKFQQGINPEVVATQEGWWQACKQLNLPSYDPFSEEGSNLNLIIDNQLIDPISGSVPHRGVPCWVRSA
jgi:anaerobic selenocysteine-containing dehydrogenase